MSAAVQHNAHQLYGDVFGYGLMAGSTLAFLPVYFARLGGSSFQVALLTAAPAVMNLLLSMPAVGWLHNRSLLRTTFDLIILNRLCYLPFLFLPWFFAPNTEIWIMVALTVVAQLPGTVINVSFNAMLADMIPPEHRAQVVGGRNALTGLSMLGTSLLCGWLLDRLPFPFNYQVVFAVGLLGLGISSLYLARLRDSFGQTPHRRLPLLAWPAAGLARMVVIARAAGRTLFPPGGRPPLRLGALVRVDLLRGPFGLFLLSYFLFYTFQYVPVPLLPLFWVNDLRLSDGVISLGNGVFHLCMLAASLSLARVATRFGPHRVLIVGAALYGLNPLLNALTYNVPLFLVSMFVGGIGWGFAAGTLATRLMDRVPAHDRPAHMALYNLALFLGVLVGSFSGSLLAGLVGLRESMYISTALRFGALLLLMLWA